jgi:hypothetical protein
MSISEHFRYRNDVFQSDIFVSDIGITDVDVADIEIDVDAHLWISGDHKLALRIYITTMSTVNNGTECFSRTRCQ